MASTSEQDQEEPPYPFNLGSYIPSLLLPTSPSPAAQKSFTQALLWSYAFNHAEAQSCFETAISHDPDCVLAYWGLAVSGGPNYNLPWEGLGTEDERRAEVEKCREWIGKAAEVLKRREGEEGVVVRLIEAVGRRYGVHIEIQADEKVDVAKNEESFDYAAWNGAYAAAMGEIFKDFGHDPDVATLYVDALMNLHPWALWDISTGKPVAGARTLEIKDLLEKSLASEEGKTHPGLLHLYVHLMEMSPKPEEALPIANRLRKLVPDAGHLLHMPTHLDVLCGDWEKAMEGNRLAIRADEKYLLHRGGKNFYTLYRCHDFHFRVYAAMFAGRYGVSLATVEGLERTLLDDVEGVLRPNADFLEAFLGMRVHVYVRFGKWKELTEMSMPEDMELCCVTAAMVRYGKGVAAAVEGDQNEAVRQRELFGEAKAKVKEGRTLFNNTAKGLLNVAATMLDGEVEYRTGNVEEGLASLRKAVELSDNLPYDEPWGWMQPPRHALGALLLEQGRVEDAKVEYEKDLGLDASVPRQLRHPNNVWAVHGYAECLKRLETDGKEVERVEGELSVLMRKVDVKIGSSCFCRKTGEVTAKTGGNPDWHVDQKEHVRFTRLRDIHALADHRLPEEAGFIYPSTFHLTPTFNTDLQHHPPTLTFNINLQHQVLIPTFDQLQPRARHPHFQVSFILDALDILDKMHAPLSTLCFALLVLFLSSLPTTSAWAIAFFEKDDCWGDAYSVHSGDDNFSGEHPGYTRPGENADNQKCYWNKDWGLIQEPCTVATAPVPKSFFISSNTGCVMGVLSEVKDKFFGDTTPGECNSLKHFRGKAALKRDPNLVFRCRSLAVMAQQDPHVVKKIGVYPTPSNGTKYSNTTGGAVTETDDEWDDDEDYLEEVPEEDVAYDMWGNLLTPTEGATNATAGVNASQG